jgi:ABC-type antimicrobial peptide transport system permease subunit
VYVPRAQAWTAPNTALVPHYLIVRMRGTASVKDASRVHAAIAPFMPDMALGTIDVQRTRDVLAPEVRPWRVTAVLFFALGLLGLAAAATGIYGLVAYEAAQRAREFGVRVALGASNSSIACLVVGSGLRVVVLGLSAGIVAALALGRLMASLLFATSAYDPDVLVGTAVMLTLAAGIASIVPAWRAARMDPARALRME